MPVKVRNDFIRYCSENKIKLEWNDGSYYMAFGKFFHEEYRVTLEILEYSVAPEADIRNDVVEQSRRVTENGINENLEDSVSERESNMEEEAVRDDKNEEINVEESKDVDEKLHKDKESFAYKLRKLRAQLFEKNENGEMSSPSILQYEKMVKKFVTKFKNYKMSSC